MKFNLKGILAIAMPVIAGVTAVVAEIAGQRRENKMDELMKMMNELTKK